MRASQLNRGLFAGVIVCGFLAFLLGRLGGPDFSTRWRNLRDGMAQAEVRQALGSPTSAGTTWTIGAGNQNVTRWEYKRGRSTYCVDFDYIGPGGAPVVFRTERFCEEWRTWPSWWPWQHASMSSTSSHLLHSQKSLDFLPRKHRQYQDRRSKRAVNQVDL